MPPVLGKRNLLQRCIISIPIHYRLHEIIHCSLKLNKTVIILTDIKQYSRLSVLLCLYASSKPAGGATSVGKRSDWTYTSQGPRTAYALCLPRVAHRWQHSIAATTGKPQKHLPLELDAASERKDPVPRASRSTIKVACLKRIIFHDRV